jgi:hypothetical protein
MQLSFFLVEMPNGIPAPVLPFVIRHLTLQLNSHPEHPVSVFTGAGAKNKPWLV